MSLKRDGSCMNLKRVTKWVTFRVKKSNFRFMFDMAVLILDGSAVTYRCIRLHKTKLPNCTHSLIMNCVSGIIMVAFCLIQICECSTQEAHSKSFAHDYCSDTADDKNFYRLLWFLTVCLCFVYFSVEMVHWNFVFWSPVGKRPPPVYPLTAVARESSQRIRWLEGGKGWSTGVATPPWAAGSRPRADGLDNVSVGPRHLRHWGQPRYHLGSPWHLCRDP